MKTSSALDLITSLTIQNGEDINMHGMKDEKNYNTLCRREKIMGKLSVTYHWELHSIHYEWVTENISVNYLNVKFPWFSIL